MLKRWRDLKVSRKLYVVVGAMAVLIAVELFTLYFAMTTLSAVRAFVGGEGLWSKAQKSGVLHLQQYASTGDRQYYLQFLEDMKVPAGDHRARLELEKPVMDMAKFREGFLAGQNHPDDIIPMKNLMRRFHEVPQLAKAVEHWKQGDALTRELIALGAKLDRQMRSRQAGPDRIIKIMRDIFNLDNKLTKVETMFSSQLGEASRWLEKVLMVLLLMAVITIEGTGLFLTISFGRGLTRDLSELNDAATRVGRGDFTPQVKVRSNDELGQLAMALNTMTANLKAQTSERMSAEHASETKNLFLANMSHEIRTPLNAILGFSEILADPELAPADRARYAAIIQRTGASLTAIIDDILEVSKVEAEKIEIEMKAFSLDQLVSDLEAVLKLKCEEKGILLNFEKMGFVAEQIKSDPLRLRQILTNIVGNSIKFTESGSVRIRYGVVNNDLAFHVEDTGGGISAEQREKLFKPFSQGDDSVRKKYGGTGLGLLISQSLAKLLGGSVELVRSSDTGTLFVIRIGYIPVTGGLKIVDCVAPPSVCDLKGKNILVVEDSPDNQLLAQVYLTSSGAKVDFAVNGAEGVEKGTTQLYDVILMDMQMPVMDGFTATRELRAHGYDGPIIALTGYARSEDQKKCMAAGCDDYIAKPFDKKTLVTCVGEWLQLRPVTPKSPGKESDYEASV